MSRAGVGRDEGRSDLACRPDYSVAMSAVCREDDQDGEIWNQNPPIEPGEAVESPEAVVQGAREEKPYEYNLKADHGRLLLPAAPSA
jgi:hypothetical protein